MVLLLVAAVSVVAALGAPVLARLLGRRTGWVLAAVFGVMTGVVAAMAPAVLVQGQTLEQVVPWMPQIGVELRLRMDGTAWLFTMLVFGIGALVMAYAARYFGSGRHTGFFFFMCAFAAAMLGLVLADDVVMMFVFWELTTICSFFLIGISGPQASRPAVRTYILTAIGGLALLSAVVLLAVRTGTTRLSTILADTAWTEDSGFVALVAALLIVAVFTKSAQFPFHYWLPDAMAASTPVSTYLHAATMVKAGIYLAMRFTPAMGDVLLWNVALITAGVVTAVLGAVFALQRHDLKELLAYSTVSQLGLLVAVIGVGTEYALAAAAVHTLAHALFKSALFMLVGVLDHEVGSRDIRDMHGLRRAMPVTAALTAIAALSLAGVPPMMGFVGKESLFDAYLDAPGGTGPLVGALAVTASVLTFAYAFRIVHGAFGGPAEPRAHVHDPHLMLLGPGVAAVAGLVLGLVVPVLDPLAERVILDTTGAEYAPHLALWHGLNVPLLMSAVALGVGAVLAWQRVAVDRALQRPLFPAKGTGVFEWLYAAVVRLGHRTGDVTRSDAPGPYLAASVSMVVFLAAWVLVAQPAAEPLTAPTSRPRDWLIVALIAVAVTGAVITQRRLGALALVGIAGFGVAMWFLLLGGFDLALTQLLVEILTVVLAALVLRRLPHRFRPVTRRRHISAGALAVASGVVAGVATWTMTGRRGLSPAGEYYLSEAEEETGGANIVNTILVDFRALDTLGELTVLGVAGLAISAVLGTSRLVRGDVRGRVRELSSNVVFPATDNTIPMRDVAFWLTPVLAGVSLWLLLRGHQLPGGGFIAALIGGAALALGYMTAPHASLARIHFPARWVIAAGIALAGVTGLLGYVEGSFLRPLHAEIPLPGGGYYHFTTALVFDLGVYLAVLGIMLAALQWLGAEDDIVRAPHRTPLPRRRPRGGAADHEHQHTPTGGAR